MASVTIGDPTGIGAFRVLFAIFGTIFNGAAIVTVLSNRNLRSKGMYITIVVISFAGLLQSIFVNSVSAHAYLSTTTNYDLCSTLFGAAITSSICLMVIMYCLVLLFVNHLIHRRSANETRERNTGIVGTILIWVLSVIVLVPVIETQSASKCFILTDYDLRVGLYVLEFFLPTFILCIAGIILIISHASSRQPRVMVQDGLSYQRSSIFPTHIVVAGFLAVVTNMPSSILSVVQFTCFGTVCNWYLWLALIFGMIAQGYCVVLPCSWLLDNDFRQAFLRKQTPNRNMAPMAAAYNNYTPQSNQVMYNNQQIPFSHSVPYAAPNTGYSEKPQQPHP
ncbi:hypothetical protein SNE40_005169 [Patella caerulea]|uniref:G-protein coupled receptors family 1 profile domain-containing protein n=1 Tax=Patella caerulea TaxID=87958 RepID=A0AAN8Q1X1_PATCE